MKLYRVQMKAGDDHLDDEIGFRTIEGQGDKILLNGKPVFLRGINIHAEAPYRGGSGWSRPDRPRCSAGRMTSLQLFRLAHYPHDEHMTREADKLGIIVWSRLPPTG